MLNRCRECDDVIPDYCELCDSCFRLEEEDSEWEREYYEDLDE